jgi:hypothetical protein
MRITVVGAALIGYGLGTDTTTTPDAVADRRIVHVSRVYDKFLSAKGARLRGSNF